MWGRAAIQAAEPLPLLPAEVCDDAQHVAVDRTAMANYRRQHRRRGGGWRHGGEDGRAGCEQRIPRLCCPRQHHRHRGPWRSRKQLHRLARLQGRCRHHCVGVCRTKSWPSARLGRRPRSKWKHPSGLSRQRPPRCVNPSCSAPGGRRRAYQVAVHPQEMPLAYAACPQELQRKGQP